MTKSRTAIIFLLLALLIAVGIPYAQNTTNSEKAEKTIATGEEPLSAGPEEDRGETLIDNGVEVTENGPPTFVDFLMAGKYLAFLILALVGLLMLLGKAINYWLRIGMLLVAFVLFGMDFIYPLHPSPMCGVTKLFMFKFTWGEFFPAFLAMFVAIFLPSLIGRKLFCGWVCPLGALQDLINKIPHKWHIKNFNFNIFNGIRGALLIMFVLVFFGVKDWLGFLATEIDMPTTSQLWRSFSGYSIYDPINFFELLHWNMSTTFYVMFTMLVIASLVLYRPFCYSICPIGFLTWLEEKISPGRIRIDHNTCTNCKICYAKSPCPTIKPLVEKAKVIPDCTSCGECIKTCPHNSIQFSFWPKSK